MIFETKVTREIDANICRSRWLLVDFKKMKISKTDQFFILAGHSRRLPIALVTNSMDQSDATGDLLKVFYFTAQNGVVDAVN